MRRRRCGRRKDGAYLERNQLVAALTKLFPAGIAKTSIPGWSEDWHGCVYIDLPSGQVSWHYHDSQATLFAHLPPYNGDWDGHDAPEKYRRLAALLLPDAAPEPQAQRVPEGWKLVPVEPTKEMIDAHFEQHARAETFFADVPQVWAAMLAAAPAPPPDGEKE